MDRLLATRLEADVHHVRSEDRRRNIDLTLGLIQSYFVDKDPPLLGHGKGLAVDFENSLRRSKIETPRYEFKQGIYRLNDGRERDDGVLVKLVEEACAIANLGPESNGFIFIGVADSETDSIRVKQLDNINPIQIGNVFVVGVDREATLANQRLELYVRLIVSSIRTSDLSEPLKSDMLGCVDTIEYRGMSVIRITVPTQKEMGWVGEQTFIREGSETRGASAKQIAALVQRFATTKA